MDVRVWGDAHSLGIWAPISPPEKQASAGCLCNWSGRRAPGWAKSPAEPRAVCKILISHCPNLAEGG